MTRRCRRFEYDHIYHETRSGLEEKVIPYMSYLAFSNRFAGDYDSHRRNAFIRHGAMSSVIQAVPKQMRKVCWFLRSVLASTSDKRYSAYMGDDHTEIYKQLNQLPPRVCSLRCCQPSFAPLRNFSTLFSNQHRRALIPSICPVARVPEHCHGYYMTSQVCRV